MFTLFNNCRSCISCINCSSVNTEDTNVTIPINWNNTKPFVPPICGGIVIKVYDGDTITIVSKLPYEKSELYRFPVRLNGIDTPEIKSHSDDEKIIAKEAREYLSNLILHKYVSVKNLNTEKYGRLLADIYLDDTHINKCMLEQRFAVEYTGGTKIVPKSWVKYRLTGEVK
jgi:endonuclease YncB( thermonuclease family)